MKTCDVHRHWAGCVAPDTICKLLKRDDVEFIRNMVAKSRYDSFDDFLTVFNIQDEIEWSREAFGIAAWQVFSDLRRTNVDFASFSISLGKYTKYGWSIDEIIGMIREYFFDLSFEFDVVCDVMIALRYDSPRELQTKCADIVFNCPNFISGIDLVGNEKLLDVDFYKPIVSDWLKRGKIVRAHAGEFDGSQWTVKKALYDLGVNRVAHGIYSDDDDLKFARDNGVVFDLALHSNMMIGTVSNMFEHPIKRMLDMGCEVTLNTDDPIQFGCTLADEFDLAMKYNLIDSKTKLDLMANAYKLYW